MPPGLVHRSAGDVVADLLAVNPGRSRQRRAGRIGKGNPGQILLDRRLLGDDDRLSGHSGRSRPGAISRIGQLEIGRRAGRLAPVEDVLDRAGSADLGPTGNAERIRFARARIERLVRLKDVVDHPVALAVRIRKAGRNSQDFTRIERYPAVPGAKVAKPCFGLDPEFLRGAARNEVDRAAGGVASEQGSLRSAQHFDPFDVHDIKPAGT